MPVQPASEDLSSNLVDAVSWQVSAVQAFVDVAAEDLRRAAQSQVAVLITARSGFERESLARLIHRGSSRGEGPFMLIHWDVQRVASLERLLDATSGGTIFLDEVGAMKKPEQDRLYALLERASGGSADPRTGLDVRIIAGTSHSLRSQVAAGTFSEGLFYRLNVIHLVLEGDRFDGGTRDAPARSHRARRSNIFPRAFHK
jgi:DNA-binding NtrC family response regulator